MAKKTVVPGTTPVDLVDPEGNGNHGGNGHRQEPSPAEIAAVRKELGLSDLAHAYKSQESFHTAKVFSDPGMTVFEASRRTRIFNKNGDGLNQVRALAFHAMQAKRFHCPEVEEEVAIYLNMLASVDGWNMQMYRDSITGDHTGSMQGPPKSWLGRFVDAATGRGNKGAH